MSSKRSAVFWIFSGSNPNLGKPGGFFPSFATLLCQLRMPLFVGILWICPNHLNKTWEPEALTLSIRSSSKNGVKGKKCFGKSRSSLQKNGKPKQPNKNEGHQTAKMPTFLTLDIQKLTEKVFVSPQNTFSAGIRMYRVRLVFLVTPPSRRCNAAPSHESVPEFRNSHNLASAMTTGRGGKLKGFTEPNWRT